QLPYSWFGHVFNGPGSLTDTVNSTTTACDTIRTLTLSVTARLTDTTNAAVCTNDLPYSWNGRSYPIAGSYRDTLFSTTGCDTLAVLNLVVSPLLTSSLSRSVCSSQLPYSWFGHVFNAAGSVTDTVNSTTAACDTIRKLTLSVTARLTDTTNAAVCTNDLPYTWHGKSYPIAGSYRDTLFSSSGCDTIAVLNLAINIGVHSDTTASACGSFTWSRNGVTYNASGNYNYTFANAQSCQDTVTLHLMINNGVQTDTTAAACGSFTWSRNGVIYTASGNYNYTFTNSQGCQDTVVLHLTIQPAVAPLFTAIGPLCQNSTPPALPATSNDGITGTWNPGAINTATIGTIDYIFTPTAGQCATVANLTVTVNTNIVPTFNPIAAICSGAAIVLPPTSIEGITGSWAPAVNNMATTIYTFTPTAGQCATPTTLTVIVTSNIAPAFTAIGPLCQNSVPPALPLISTNGINGTWSPAIINTATAGITDYTFIPTTGLCATRAILSVTIDPQITPAFTPIGTLCQNSTAPALSTTSNNGITGTWSPATINTTTAGITTYTFTPAAGLCATATTVIIEVNPILYSTTDITICTLQLPYTWNGQTFTAAGTYVVRLQSSFGCDSMATLKLQVKAVLTSTTNVSICASQVPYIWNGQSYTQPGTYTYRQTTQAGCDSLATLILDITPLAAASVSGGGTICKGGTAMLNLTFTGTGPWTLVYTNGTTADTIRGIPASPYQIGVTPVVTTTYSIISVADIKCTNSSVTSTATVTVVAAKQGVRYTTQLALTNQPRQLLARSLGNGYSYTWTPPVGLNFYNIYNPLFTYNKATEYLISLKNNAGCLTIDTILVKVLPPPSDSALNIFVPKAWTPNGDGRNDYLVPVPANIRELKFFRVFNRWGQLVYETNQLLQGWDGMFKGKPQAMDVFTWTAEGIGIDGKYFRKSGNSALLR
ncbi:MAG: gliding motility-associated C-terminal domain-containing protein, partial [Chitinophagaceae bacterium]